jgi:hypothetical protein
MIGRERVGDPSDKSTRQGRVRFNYQLAIAKEKANGEPIGVVGRDCVAAK